MRYFGGKKKVAKHIIDFLKQKQFGTKYYFEPFVGSAAIIEGISGVRYASDANEYLIEMYKALQEGWVPPPTITEEDYAHVKENKDKDKALTAFVGIGCSYSGKWFGGYCRDNTDRNYALNAKNTLLKQLPKIKDVVFKHEDYRNCHPKNALVYCDPPYFGTTAYDAIGRFDSEEFWNTVRKWSKSNLVFVSEYSAPKDFDCILEIPTKTDIRNKSGVGDQRIEKLFKLIQ